MLKIDSLTGASLMRLWGVNSWPEINADYWLWDGCCVFSTIDHGTHVDLHMAMRKEDRKACRDAVADILSIIGNREIHAPILIESKHVCNLAKKFGFVESWRGIVEMVGRDDGELIIMKRRKWVE